LKPEWWGSPLVQEENYQERPVEREGEIMIIQFNSINIFTFLTTARLTNYSQAQKQLYRLTLKNRRKI
jgi:hypothetical protein